MWIVAGLSPFMISVSSESRPADDVDPLAAQLVDDGLDPRAAHAHAGADAVDLRILGDHAHLGAVAGLPHDALDLDDVVGDLGHFQLEEPPHQVGVGAADDDAHPRAVLADLQHDRADAVAGGEGLAPHPLLARQVGLGAAQVDHQVVVLEALHGPVDQAADARLVLVVDHVALGLTHLLQEGLLAGLGGDAAQLGQVELVFALVVLHADLAALAVDRDDEILAGPKTLFHRRGDRGLQTLEEDFRRDVLLPVENVDHAQDVFLIHGGDASLGFWSVSTAGSPRQRLGCLKEALGRAVK